jgi:hypothetical protein
VKVNIKIFLITILACFFAAACDRESAHEKAETEISEASDAIKETARDIDDKLCKMINGKLECVAKEAEHSLKNAADQIETKANEAKNKLDK